MIFLWEVFEIFTTCFESATIVYFLYGTLNGKFDKSKNAFFAVIFVLIHTLIVFAINSWRIVSWQAYDVVFFVLCIFYAYFCLNGNLIKKALVCLVCLFMLNGVIVFVSSIVSSLSGASVTDLITGNNWIRAMTMIVIRVVHFYLCVILIRILSSDRKAYLLELFVVLLNFILANVSMSIAYGVIVSAHNDSQIIVLMTLIVSLIVVMGIGTYALFVYAAWRYERNAALKLNKQNLAFDEKEIRNINESYMNVKKIQHDTNNYLLCLEEMINNGKYEDSKKYIVEVRDHTRQLTLNRVECDNVMVSSILNVKIEAAMSKQIDVKCLITAPLSNLENSVDFCGLLSNLLDNAIESSEKQQKKKIEIDIKKLSGELVLIIKNNLDKSFMQTNPNLLTTKKEKANHGFGNRIIKDYARRLSGTVKYFEVDNEFGVMVII